MSGVCKKSSAYMSHGASTSKNCVKNKACSMSSTKCESKSCLSMTKKGDGHSKTVCLHGTFKVLD